LKEFDVRVSTPAVLLFEEEQESAYRERRLFAASVYRTAPQMEEEEDDFEDEDAEDDDEDWEDDDEEEDELEDEEEDDAEDDTARLDGNDDVRMGMVVQAA